MGGGVVVPPVHSLLDWLTWADWVRLGLAALLFLGPGFALATFHPDRNCWDKTQTLALALGLAIGFWAVLLAWTGALGLSLNTFLTGAILAAGWIVGLARTRPWKTLRRWPAGRFRPDLFRVALWAILLVIAAAGVAALRHVVVGPGSDSYHHTLFVQMIVERGRLPDSLEPYAPIATFSYHYGFHGLVAALVWLTGITPVALVPLAEQVLVACAALAVAFLTEEITHSRKAAMISAACAGLLSLFPSYFINWGRDTQLTGMVLLPLLLALTWRWIQSGYSWSRSWPLGLFAAGVALAHYRVTLMAALGGAVLLAFELVAARRWDALKRIAAQLALAVVMAAGLALPWLLHVLDIRRQGYPVDVGDPGPTFFSLDRIGMPPGVDTRPDQLLIGLALVAVLVAAARRNRPVLALAAWTLGMLALSTPRIAGIFMDTISVAVALYIPLSIAAAWLVALLMGWLAHRWRAARWAVWAALLVLCVEGTLRILWLVQPGAAYVGTDDLQAITWIRANTPPAARFMVNTFHWDFMPRFVVGSDAGYWLPLLAGRSTVTVPMIYSFERSREPDLVETLAALDRLGGRLTTPEALALLRREQVTHVYVGERGGPIVTEELRSSPAFQLEYENHNTFVFRFLGAAAP